MKKIIKCSYLGFRLPLFSPTGSLLYSVGNEELFTSDRYAAKRTNINIQSRMVLMLKMRTDDKLRLNELYYILPYYYVYL